MAEETRRAQAARLALHLQEDESGQNLIEYGLLAGLIGIACIVALTSVKTNIATLFNAVGSKLRSF